MSQLKKLKQEKFKNENISFMKDNNFENINHRSIFTLNDGLKLIHTEKSTLSVEEKRKSPKNLNQCKQRNEKKIDISNITEKNLLEINLLKGRSIFNNSIIDGILGTIDIPSESNLTKQLKKTNEKQTNNFSDQMSNLTVSERFISQTQNLFFSKKNNENKNKKSFYTQNEKITKKENKREIQEKIKKILLNKGNELKNDIQPSFSTNKNIDSIENQQYFNKEGSKIELKNESSKDRNNNPKKNKNINEKNIITEKQNKTKLEANNTKLNNFHLDEIFLSSLAGGDEKYNRTLPHNKDIKFELVRKKNTRFQRDLFFNEISFNKSTTNHREISKLKPFRNKKNNIPPSLTDNESNTIEAFTQTRIIPKCKNIKREIKSDKNVFLNTDKTDFDCENNINIDKPSTKSFFENIKNNNKSKFLNGSGFITQKNIFSNNPYSLDTNPIEINENSFNEATTRTQNLTNINKFMTTKKSSFKNLDEIKISNYFSSSLYPGSNKKASESSNILKNTLFNLNNIAYRNIDNFYAENNINKDLLNNTKILGENFINSNKNKRISESRTPSKKIKQIKFCKNVKM